MSKHRIELLDGFRCLAILSVLLFHFTERWTDLYPYKGAFSHIFFFGYLGVNFFFMISGFVISYSLENTPDPSSFFRNRFSRLVPPMLLCTLVTFAVCTLLDDRLLFPNAHKIKNFLPSLTFVSPALWTWMTRVNFSWINGSYWSLWPEIQFYAIAAAVYFFNKKKFFRNLLLVGTAIALSKYIPLFLLHGPWTARIPLRWTSFFSEWKYADEIFNISFFILWFLAGAFFYQLHKGFGQGGSPSSVVYPIILLLFIPAETRIFSPVIFYPTLVGWFIMLGLFLLLIYRKEWLFFLRYPFLRRIGIISYSLYLIHEDIGVLLINKYGGYLGSLSLFAPFIVIALFTCFADISYRSYERKAAAFCRKITF